MLIAATLYICYFRDLNGIGFVGPDEPRYAWIARDMAESGDWVTPRLYGRPWFEKPPLLYWGGAVFFKLLPGQPETAARLPSALSALLATLSLAWLGWRTAGEECARWLLLLLPMSVGMTGFSHACATDMPFAAMLTAAMVCAAVILGLVPPDEDTPVLPRTPWLELVLFGFFLGLAVLAKGPAALILAGGAVFFWALWTKRWRAAIKLVHPAAIAPFCATALPWYLLCAHRNPDFFRVFIIEHNFKRYLTPEFQHIQPFWFYLPILVIGLWPWLPAAVAAAFAGGRTAPESPSRPLAILFASWCAWTLLFFSVSQSKLPGYILPAIPSAVFLLAQMLFAGSRQQPARRSFSLVLGATLMLSGVLFVVFQEGIPSGQDVSPAPWHASLYLPLFFGGAVSLACAWRKRVSASLVVAAAALLAAILGLHSGLPWLDWLYSTRNSTQAAAAWYPGFNSSQAAVFEARRGVQFGLNFYLRREIPVWSGPDAGARWVFTSRRGVERVERAGFRCPHGVVFPAVIPCTLPDSLGGLGSGGKAQ